MKLELYNPSRQTKNMPLDEHINMYIEEMIIGRLKLEPRDAYTYHAIRSEVHAYLESLWCKRDIYSYKVERYDSMLYVSFNKNTTVKTNSFKYNLGE